MDIALCKIDLKNQQVAYAGAHRSLYFLNAGELEEIKGNKFPIGGGIYKNQTKFTSTTIDVKKGDSIFFCSTVQNDYGKPLSNTRTNRWKKSTKNLIMNGRSGKAIRSRRTMCC